MPIFAFASGNKSFNSDRFKNFHGFIKIIIYGLNMQIIKTATFRVPISNMIMNFKAGVKADWAKKTVCGAKLHSARRFRRMNKPFMGR